MNKTTQIRRNNCNSIVYTSFCYILILCFILTCTTINYHSALIYLLYIYILNFLSYHCCTVNGKTLNVHSFFLKRIIFSLWENIYVVNFHFISFIYNFIYVCKTIHVHVFTRTYWLKKNHSLKQVHMLVFTKRLQKNISNYKNILFLFIKFV